MTIVGFSFKKYDCERNEVKEVKGNIEINHNISIENVSEISLNLGSGNTPSLKVDFVFSVVYSDSLGSVKIFGDVIFADTKEIIAETYKGWNSDKKLNSLVNEEILKFVYNKVSVQSILLADSLNLPSPIPLPKLNFGEVKSKD